MFYSSTHAYFLDENTSGNIYPSDVNYRKRGFSVRRVTITHFLAFCPKNWKLPTSGSSGQFQALYAAYGSNKTTFDSSWHPAYVGDFNNGSFHRSGTSVNWWSSTSYSSTRAYYLFESTSGIITPSYYDSRRDGFSVRCVANLRQYSLFDSYWHPAYVGHFGNGSFYYSGTYALWWSSTSNSSTVAYDLYEDTSDDINPSNNYGYRRRGFSVRCTTSSILPGIRRMWEYFVIILSDLLAQKLTGGVMSLIHLPTHIVYSIVHLALFTRRITGTVGAVFPPAAKPGFDGLIYVIYKLLVKR